MKHNYFTRKTRQLNLLVKKLRLALESGEKSQVLIERLKLRISLLLKELTGYFSKRQLKGILGSLAVIFGLTLNTNAQTFGPVVQNPFGISNPAAAILGVFDDVDLDGDGDFDLIQTAYGGSPYGGALNYYQNTGTSTAPVFGTPLVNPFGLTASLYYGAPVAADLDNDGDMDLLVGGYDGISSGQIQYFENTGTATAPAFAAPVLNPFGLSNTLYLSFLTTADIDNDGDVDILTSQAYGDLIYFENTGTASSPAFTTPVSNPFGFVPLVGTFSFPNLGDLDGDGDYDLIVGEIYGSINYFENTGTQSTPAFATSVSNPFGLTSVYYYAGPNFVNLDGDCDLDLMVSEYYSTLNYFENTTGGAVDATVTTVGLTMTANAIGATYQWIDCNNGNAPIVGATAQSFTATANGSYAVEVTMNGCSDVSSCVTISIIGLEEATLLNGVSIYPNPTNGVVTIDLGSLNSASIKVTGMNGQVVYQNEAIESTAHHFELTDAAGIYFVEITALGETQVFKLVKK